MHGDLHPLLRRQLEQAQISDETNSGLGRLLQMISTSYHQFEISSRQLEQSLNIHKKQKRHTDLKLEQFTRKPDNVVNNIAEVIFETDLQGNWVYLNPAWEKLTGLKVIDCLGQPYSEYLHLLARKDRHEFNGLINKDFDAYCKVLQIKTSNNTQIWLDISLKKVYSEEGAPIGYIGSIWDITEQKEVELSLLKAKEKEALANRAKDEFLSTITHEIRTPLNAVIGTSHLLLLENPQDSQLENLNVLKHSSEHLLSLVNDILDFGKIASGNIELETIAFSLDDRLNGLLATFGKLAQENKIEFSIQKDERIPEYLVGDCTRLSQVLTNLLSNAIKFTENGEVALKIDLLNKERDSVKVNFEVIDTGIGIPKQKQELIFEAFTQANSSTARKFGGTGLGLSISKKLVELMNGKILLNSEPGVGSIFSFALNFDISEIKPKHKQYDKVIENKTSLENLSVLVAEDNRINVLMVKKFLSKWNAVVEVAENGQEAVEKCRNNSYDVVLMDILMPIMNGFEASKAIRQFDLNIPIIALSASSGAHIMDEFIGSGIDGHIGKPFNPNTLYELLYNVRKNGRVNTRYDLGFI
ncbi:ATP-binding protein [Allomuricauda sp. d1]|uniref:PAS domain-containing hybrid sensor histidine kinase/response regulator n=1 Tax=Allomuricauda sp. d1 TaxID=3136725 RepID=UPI0031D6C04F